MKFRGHETFFIRKGWLTKGMKYVSKRPDVFISKEEKPMDVLGIGSNMVRSLRYWMQATGITTEPKHGKRMQSFTPLGKLIATYDRYLEEQGTLAILQYELASAADEATSWYFFFNEFQMQEFNRDDFVNGLKNYVLMQNETAAAERSYQDDFSCLISSYLPRDKSGQKQIQPEDNIACPLGELGLIDYVNRSHKIYRKTMAAPQLIPSAVAMAIILLQQGTKYEVSLKELLRGRKSLGNAFNLDMAALLFILKQLEQQKALKIVRTAGLDMVRIMTEDTAESWLEHYYHGIREK